MFTIHRFSDSTVDLCLIFILYSIRVHLQFVFTKFFLFLLYILLFLVSFAIERSLHFLMVAFKKWIDKSENSTQIQSTTYSECFRFEWKHFSFFLLHSIFWFSWCIISFDFSNLLCSSLRIYNSFHAKANVLFQLHGFCFIIFCFVFLLSIIIKVPRIMYCCVHVMCVIPVFLIRFDFDDVWKCKWRIPIWKIVIYIVP